MIPYARFAYLTRSVSYWFNSTALSIAVNMVSDMAETIPRAIEGDVVVVAALPDPVEI